MATTQRVPNDILRLIAEAAGDGLSREARATAVALMRVSKLFHLWIAPLLYHTVILDTPIKITQFHNSTVHVTIAQYLRNLLIKTTLPEDDPTDWEFYNDLCDRYRHARIRHLGINDGLCIPPYISWIPASHMSIDDGFWRAPHSPFYSVTHLHLHALQALPPFYMCCDSDLWRTFPALRVLRLDVDWYETVYGTFDLASAVNLLLANPGLERLMVCLPASCEKARGLSGVQDARLIVGIADPDFRAKWEADAQGVASMWECVPHPLCT